MRKTLFLISIIALMTSCLPSFDISSIDMNTLDNKEFSNIIEKTDIKKLIATEKGDVGGTGNWKCNIKLVLYSNGTCDYTIGENVTDYSVNKTTSGSTSKGTWSIDKNASMYGGITNCINRNVEYTCLVITLESGAKSTAVMFKEDSRLMLIDCDNGGRNGSLCEQLDEHLLVVPFGILVSDMSFRM